MCATMDGSPSMTDLQDANVKEPAVMTDWTQEYFRNNQNI